MQTNPGRGSGKEPDVRFGSERPEPNKSKPTAQRLDPIDLFMPGLSDNERSLRRRLHWIQGAAATAAQRSLHCRARTLLWLASQWAADATFRAPAGDLRELIAGMARLQSVAQLIERTEQPDE